ncbi:MAG: carboxypeptidase regulatory-like domain-containing protein, partial [Vicinamibacteria bacterium]
MALAGHPLRVFATEVEIEEAPPECRMTGRVVSSNVPLPGVAIILSSPSGAELGATASGLDGTFLLSAPAPGVYSVGTSLAGFTDVAQTVTLPEGTCRAVLDLAMVLQSRSPKVVTAETKAPAERTQATDTGKTAAPSVGLPNARTRARGTGPTPPGRRFQDLSVRPEGAAADATSEGATDAIDPSAQALLPGGFAADAPTESIAMAAGSQIQTVDSLLFRDRLQMLEEEGGDIDALARRMAAQGGLDGSNGFGAGGGGGPGGGFGGGRGPGGGGPGGGFGGGPGGGGRGRSRLQGSVNYNLAGSPLDARPYALNGRAVEKPDYFQHRYGATLGGPLKIPHVYDGSARTSFALTYSGTHTRSPFDAYSTVPTLAERDGDFTALGRTIVDPVIGESFLNAVIPS